MTASAATVSRTMGATTVVAAGESTGAGVRVVAGLAASATAIGVGRMLGEGLGIALGVGAGLGPGVALGVGTGGAVGAGAAAFGGATGAAFAGIGWIDT
jgi:hypothetical protein